ncbi:MAG TPA: hypothetical protein VFW35_09860 [Sphingomicrobium sp.]|nr:hypothetical protein [Sphingomicrobium sp.]
MFRLSLLLLGAAPAALAAPAAAPDVGQSIAQVRSFATAAGDKLWPGYGSAPFEFLLVAGDQEQLFCRTSAPSGFKADGTDSASGCARYVRPRSGLPDKLLAALPIFGPPSTIVMGTPKTTGRSDADWTRTILHEHFHEWQDSLPGFYPRVAKLDLAGTDNTGMWMLNYPFPYSDPAVDSAFNEASHALGAAVDARGKAGFKAALDKYLDARAKLAKAAGDRNWRYAEFELWKEGIARWTEIELGKVYPDSAVRESAAQLEQKSRAWLDKPDLSGTGREFVYPYGTGEAMLLEACDPAWRSRYPKELALGPLLEAARHNCRD